MSYVYDPASNTIEIYHQYDRNEDGSWDREDVAWTTTTLTQHALNVNPAGTSMPCTQAQADQLQMNYQGMVDNAISCINDLDSHLALQFMHEVAATDVDVDCSSVGGDCGHSSPRSVFLRQYLGVGHTVISLNSGTFSDPTGCPGAAEGTLFHEMLHHVLGAHHDGDGQHDPGDRMWGCQAFCFGHEHNQNGCAQCLGARTTDARCAPLPPSPCTTGDYQETYRCACTGAISRTASGCAAGCTGCFDPRCQGIGPCRTGFP